MGNLSNEQILSNLYYDIESGYGSAKSLYEQAKQKNAGITMDEVKSWIRKQPNKQISGYKNYNSYMSAFPRDQFQMDIMDIISLVKGLDIDIKKVKFRYGFIIIDTFSKLADVVPMINRDSETILEAMKQSFRKMGFPISIYSDDDGAFKSVVKKFLDDNGINHIITLTHANVVERLIRTIKKGIADRMRFTKETDWVKMLEPTLKKYNNTIHSSTGVKPVEAHDDKNQLKVKSNLLLKQKRLRKYPNIEKGDYVKIYTKGAGNYTSRKETNSRWSNSRYKVVEIGRDISLNKYYKVEGKDKRYMRHEILLVED